MKEFKCSICGKELGEDALEMSTLFKDREQPTCGECLDLVRTSSGEIVSPELVMRVIALEKRVSKLEEKIEMSSQTHKP